MEELPDLDRLGVAGKDELIRTLFAQVKSLTAKVAELEGRLAQNSRNSSKPPSSDILKKHKPKSQRPSGQHPTGGQKGHAGHTFEQVAQPDHIEIHAPPSHCDACQRPLTGAAVVERRQVFSMPPLFCEVTEHQVLQARCACSKMHQSELPARIAAPARRPCR